MTENKLTPKQEQAAMLYACGKSRQEIAEQLSVSVQTLTRWRAMDSFKERQEEHLQEFLRELQPVALSVIVDLLKDPNPWVRVNAAREILSRGNTELKKDSGQNVIRIIGMPELGTPVDTDEE